MSLYDCDIYPSINLTDQADESVPKSLSTLLKGILNPGDKSDTSMKRALTIAHSIIAACRPRSFISPILLSVAIYIHRRYGSRELVDILNSLGLAANYREIQRYEYSLMSDEPSYNIDGFAQFVFDNADINACTLDGKNTFHSMGGIACVTPGGTPLSTGPIARVKTVPSAELFDHMVCTNQNLPETSHFWSQFSYY